MTDDLTTAGVAPQVPNQNETKSGNNFVSLDPEKVADVISYADTALDDLPSPGSTRNGQKVVGNSRLGNGK